MKSDTIKSKENIEKTEEVDEFTRLVEEFINGNNDEPESQSEVEVLFNEKDIQNKETALDQLNSLIGLENIKEAVKRDISFHRIMELRKSAGRRTPNRIPHLLLVGNPGCGKTTVAKLIGKIYYETGILEKDIFIETNRASLVGRFIGESESQTTELINEARGGILFIDEIYSLANGDGNDTRDFGKKVIDTLIPVLSDPNSHLMVIGAGYPEEMKQFLAMNPGLASRFPLVLNFNDFSFEQLMEIAYSQIKKYDFHFSVEADAKFRSLIQDCMKIKNGGNARMVVTTLDSYVIPRLCMRVDTSDLATINVDDTSVILPEDIPSYDEVAFNHRNKNISCVGYRV